MTSGMNRCGLRLSLMQDTGRAAGVTAGLSCPLLHLLCAAPLDRQPAKRELTGSVAVRLFGIDKLSDGRRIATLRRSTREYTPLAT